jgi:hypothetical protein
MSAVPTLTDPTKVPTYAPTAFQRGIESMLFDPRDAVFVRLTLKAILVMVPAITLLYLHFSWWVAPFFWLGQLLGLGSPVILMLHNTMHRPFIKAPRWVNRAHPYAMSLLFGIPTGYMEHHLGMHHVENNLRADLSSTMRFQRDSFFDWLRYAGRFLFFIHFDLWSYLSSKNRRGMAIRAIGSDYLHVIFMVAMCFVNWQATFVAFIAPYFIVRTMMMVGNWGQHAFIDPSRPGDSYVNSITCINSVYNQRCFNDGYHIGHHVKQNRHWAELPQDFLDNMERYRKEGCIVFEGLDFFFVSVLLYLHRYDVLARLFVRLPGDERTDAEVIAFLKSRTARIADDVPEGAVLNA